MLLTNLLANYLPSSEVRSHSVTSTSPLTSIYNPYRIRNTPPDRHLSPHTKLPSNSATHLCVQTVSPQSKKKYDHEITWPAPALSDTG